MPTIDSPEAMKQYLKENTSTDPGDTAARTLYKLVELEGANPLHIKLAYGAGVSAQKID